MFHNQSAAAVANTFTAKLSIRIPSSSTNMHLGMLWHHQRDITRDVLMLAEMTSVRYQHGKQDWTRLTTPSMTSLSTDKSSTNKHHFHTTTCNYEGN